VTGTSAASSSGEELLVGSVTTSRVLAVDPGRPQAPVLDYVVEDLHRRLGCHLPHATIAGEVLRCYRRLVETATIMTYLPILAGRAAAENLRRTLPSGREDAANDVFRPPPPAGT
jgi:hypothetical protein